MAAGEERVAGARESSAFAEPLARQVPRRPLAPRPPRPYRGLELGDADRQPLRYEPEPRRGRAFLGLAVLAGALAAGFFGLRAYLVQSVGTRLAGAPLLESVKPSPPPPDKAAEPPAPARPDMAPSSAAAVPSTVPLPTATPTPVPTPSESNRPDRFGQSRDRGRRDRRGQRPGVTTDTGDRRDDQERSSRKYEALPGRDDRTRGSRRQEDQAAGEGAYPWSKMPALAGQWDLSESVINRTNGRRCETTGVLDLKQAGSAVMGRADADDSCSQRGEDVVIAQGRMDGRSVAFTTRDCDYRGTVRGEPAVEIVGSVHCRVKGASGEQVLAGTWRASRH
jgi:hypothetical protein